MENTKNIPYSIIELQIPNPQCLILYKLVYKIRESNEGSNQNTKSRKKAKQAERVWLTIRNVYI